MLKIEYIFDLVTKNLDVYERNSTIENGNLTKEQKYIYLITSVL